MSHDRPKRPPLRCLALTGFMGSGKSTVGALVARKLHWKFVDLDRSIASREGQSIPELFEQRGEPEFRRIESEMLGQALAQHEQPTVIALGGGTFVQETNRDLLQEHGVAVIYLEGSFEVLAERCAPEIGTRPLFHDHAHARRLLEERHPVYRMADFTVDVTDRSPFQVAKEILVKIVGHNAARAVPE